MGTNDLSGQTAVITGAAGGLGMALCKRFVSAGANVCMWDINETALAAAAKEIEPNGMRRISVVDVTSTASVRAGAKAALEFGPVSILVNNVGISTYHPSLEEPDEHFMRVLDANLLGQLRCCREFMPIMIERGYGRVVNISSAAAIMCFPGHASYNCSKAGVIALTKTLAKEYGTTGVIVNCVVPGYFDTPLFRKNKPAGSGSDPYTPIGRIGQPDELAQIAQWLSSPACSYTTGAAFDCSGGIAI